MRLFISIQFNNQILSSLTDIQDELSAMGVTGNYTKPENLHLTLAFIGDYGDPDAVLDAMAGTDFRPFPIRLDGVGIFGEIFWAGIEENPALMAYTKRLRRALSDEDMVNPVITKKSGKYETEESCLFLEGRRPCVRYKEIEVDYLDQNFKKQHGKYSGFTAQIIQHEIQHFSGDLI